MSTRIRYTKTDGGIRSRPFKTPDNELTIHILTGGWVAIYNKNIITVYDDRQMMKLPNGETQLRTINNAKKFAKKALQSLGVVFEQECRPRIKNNEGKETKKEVLKLYQDSIMEDEINKDARRQYENDNIGDK
jgi:hypothetical protein